MGATVGKSEHRVQAAEALVAAIKSSAASIPEIAEMILQAIHWLRSCMSMFKCQACVTNHEKQEIIFARVNSMGHLKGASNAYD